MTCHPLGDHDLRWREAALTFPRTGLWPVVLTGGDRLHLDPVSASDPTVRGVEQVLSARWSSLAPVRQDEVPVARPPWPGLAQGTVQLAPGTVELPAGAPGGTGGAGWVQFDHHSSGWTTVGRGVADLLLAAVSRPADVPALLGWAGAVNQGLTGRDVTAVLRSWEDRFGAHLVGLGPAELDLVVSRPPTADDASRVLAQEHLALCPDTWYPQTWPDASPIEHGEYARRLQRANSWHLWWD